MQNCAREELQGQRPKISVPEVRVPEVRGGGQEALPHDRGSGKAAKRNNPKSKEWQLHKHRRAKRSYSMFKVIRDGHEEIPSSKLRSSGCTLLEQP